MELRLPNLHICVTSRPEIDIRNRLEPLTSLRVSLHDQTGHKEDIAKYILSEVDFIADEKRWRQDDKDLVIETLSEKADGMQGISVLSHILLSRFMKQVPMGTLSAGDAEALPPIETSAIST